MDEDTSIESLINFVTAETLKTPDINTQIEIASRFVDNRKDLILGIRHIDGIMRKGKIKSKYFALCLIEIWSK